MYQLEDAPRGPGADIVFLGRSNVGKSSLINRLLGTRGLARTSSQPGRTQSANFYRVNEAFNFVDLPGYGYARVPEKVRAAWGPLVEGLLEHRQDRIALALLVVDARRDPTELDKTMKAFLESKHVDFLVAATKSDKLSGNEKARAKRLLAEQLGDSERGAPMLVSSTAGAGMRDLWRHLDHALGERSGDAGRTSR